MRVLHFKDRVFCRNRCITEISSPPYLPPSVKGRIRDPVLPALNIEVAEFRGTYGLN